MSSINLGNLVFTVTADDSQLDGKFESGYAKARAYQQKMAQLTKVPLDAGDGGPSSSARRPSARDRAAQLPDYRAASMAISRQRRPTALASADDDEVFEPSRRSSTPNYRQASLSQRRQVVEAASADRQEQDERQEQIRLGNRAYARNVQLRDLQRYGDVRTSGDVEGPNAPKGPQANYEAEVGRFQPRTGAEDRVNQAFDNLFTDAREEEGQSAKDRAKAIRAIDQEAIRGKRAKAQRDKQLDDAFDRDGMAAQKEEARASSKTAQRSTQLDDLFDRDALAAQKDESHAIAKSAREGEQLARRKSQSNLELRLSKASRRQQPEILRDEAENYEEGSPERDQLLTRANRAEAGGGMPSWMKRFILFEGVRSGAALLQGTQEASEQTTLAGNDQRALLKAQQTQIQTIKSAAPFGLGEIAGVVAEGLTGWGLQADAALKSADATDADTEAATRWARYRQTSARANAVTMAQGSFAQRGQSIDNNSAAARQKLLDARNDRLAGALGQKTAADAESHANDDPAFLTWLMGDPQNIQNYYGQNLQNDTTKNLQAYQSRVAKIQGDFNASDKDNQQAAEADRRRLAIQRGSYLRSIPGDFMAKAASASGDSFGAQYIQLKTQNAAAFDTAEGWEQKLGATAEGAGDMLELFGKTGIAMRAATTDMSNRTNIKSLASAGSYYAAAIAQTKADRFKRDTQISQQFGGVRGTMPGGNALYDALMQSSAAEEKQEVTQGGINEDQRLDLMEGDQQSKRDLLMRNPLGARIEAVNTKYKSALEGVTDPAERRRQLTNQSLDTALAKQQFSDEDTKIGLNLSTQSTSLDRSLARDPTGAQSADILGAGEGDLVDLYRSGHKAQLAQSRANTAKRLDLLKQNYTNQFGVSQVDIRQMDLTSPNDVENPGKVLAGIDADRKALINFKPETLDPQKAAGVQSSGGDGDSSAADIKELLAFVKTLPDAIKGLLQN